MKMNVVFFSLLGGKPYHKGEGKEIQMDFRVKIIPWEGKKFLICA